MLYCGYGNFTGEEDDLMQDRKLEQALEIYFQENPDRESDKYQEIQKYLKLRIRSVMELLIENEDTERMEQIEKCGWFSANELENFIRCAQEKAKLRSLVWLLHLKDKKYGYQKKDFSLYNNIRAGTYRKKNPAKLQKSIISGLSLSGRGIYKSGIQSRQQH